MGWVLLLFGQSAWAQQAESGRLAERFSREAPAAWTKYESRYAQAQGTVDVVLKTVQNGKPGLQEYSVRLKSNEECLLAEALSYRAEGENVPRLPLELRAANERYEFKLTRAGPTLPWTVSNVTAPDSVHWREGVLATFQVRKQTCPVSLKSRSLRSIVALSGFHVTAIGDQDGLILVAFKLTPTLEESSTGGSSLQSGELLLDPKRMWSLTHAEYSIRQGTALIQESVDFHLTDPDSDGFGLPREVASKSTATQPPFEASVRYTCEWEVPSPLPPASEFTLTAYGFPEPEWARPRKPWWLYLGAAAVALVALGAWAVHCRNEEVWKPPVKSGYDMPICLTREC